MPNIVDKEQRRSLAELRRECREIPDLRLSVRRLSWGPQASFSLHGKKLRGSTVLAGDFFKENEGTLKKVAELRNKFSRVTFEDTEDENTYVYGI